MADNPAGLASAVVPNLVAPEAITLTTEQKSLVRDIVSRFDTDNLSREDREEIRSSLKAADIGPSRALFNELQKAGVVPPAPDSHRDRPLGGPPPEARPHGAPPPDRRPVEAAKDDEESAVQKRLNDVLGRYDVENLAPKEVDKLRDELDAARGDRNGPVVNLIG